MHTIQGTREAMVSGRPVISMDTLFQMLSPQLGDEARERLNTLVLLEAPTAEIRQELPEVDAWMRSVCCVDWN